MSRIYALANQKGGVGKTTTAINVAACIAEAGARVLLVDFDPQANATTGLGLRPPRGRSTYDLLHGAAMSDIIVETTTPGLALAPAHPDLAAAAVELPDRGDRDRILGAALAEVGDEYPYVLVDCPPSLGMLTIKSLAAANRLIVPVQCEYYALEGLAQLLGTIEMVQSYLNKALRITTVLLTMYDSRTRLADQVAADVRNHFTGLVVEAVIPRNVRVSEAPGYGQTVMTYDPGSRGAISYLQAAYELAGRVQEAVS